FFSSRRRHTRCLSDWSSDVCSSDLFRTFLLVLDPRKRSYWGCLAASLSVWLSFLAPTRWIVPLKLWTRRKPQSDCPYSRLFLTRSEERRVGKACSYEMYREHCKIKN